MNRIPKYLALSCLALALVGCESRTDRTDGGGVLLSVTDFDGLPINVSASTLSELAQIESITITNVAKNPTGNTSALMNVEIQSYEVTFERLDGGTRTPPKLIEYVFGVVPVDGTMVLDNGPFMRAEQFNTQPILGLANTGLDSETGSRSIRLRVGLRFFGHTLSGDAVDSAPAFFTIDVVP